MTDTLPLDNEERPPDRPRSEHVPPPSDRLDVEQLLQEYSSGQVSEIIRVALERAHGGDRSSVSREEMLAIAGEFGLSAADLIRASETIAASREETDRSSKTKQKAMQDFRLHLFCYAAAIVGLFLLNWAVSPEYWWFILATIAYGPVVAVHGFIARYNPELALSLLGEETHGPSEGLSSMSPVAKEGK